MENYSDVNPGDEVKVTKGTFKGKKGRFCYWPQVGRKSAWVTFDEDETPRKLHCLRCINLIFTPSISSGNKRTRRSTPVAATAVAPTAPVMIETIDVPPSEQQTTHDEEASLSREELRAMMAQFAELNFAIRDMSDRVGKLEFQERK